MQSHHKSHYCHCHLHDLRKEGATAPARTYGRSPISERVMSAWLLLQRDIGVMMTCVFMHGDELERTVWS